MKSASARCLNLIPCCFTSSIVTGQLGWSKRIWNAIPGRLKSSRIEIGPCTPLCASFGSIWSLCFYRLGLILKPVIAFSEDLTKLYQDKFYNKLILLPQGESFRSLSNLVQNLMNSLPLLSELMALSFRIQ